MNRRPSPLRHLNTRKSSEEGWSNPSTRSTLNERLTLNILPSFALNANCPAIGFWRPPDSRLNSYSGQLYPARSEPHGYIGRSHQSG
jgi:hypothetical protein